MNDVAKGGAGARSWISENGGVVAIVMAIIAVGALIHRGDQQIAASLASLETQFGAPPPNVHLASTRHHSCDRCSQAFPVFSRCSTTERKLKNK